MSPLSRTALQYSLLNEATLTAEAFSKKLQIGDPLRRQSLPIDASSKSLSPSNVPTDRKAPSPNASHRPEAQSQRMAKSSSEILGPTKSLPKKQPDKNLKPANQTLLVTSPAPICFDDPKRRSKFERSQPIPRTKSDKIVSLFSHLPQYEREHSITSWLRNSKEHIHPEIVRLGAKFASFQTIGANSRCIALLETFKKIITEHQTPNNTTLGRHLDSLLKPMINFLVQFRPLAPGMGNAIRFLKCKIAEVPIDYPEEQAKVSLCDSINTFLQNRIRLAGELVSQHGNTKINNEDVILVFTDASVVVATMERAYHDGKRFRVVVLDSRPLYDGRSLLKRLSKIGISCTYALISSLGYVMRDVTKVLLDAITMFSNGNAMGRVGNALISAVARSMNVPVCIFCETYKFTERMQIDSFVFNELPDPDYLVNRQPNSRDRNETLVGWRDIPALKLLNIMYDVTPAENITVVITDVGMIPCTSIPVVLREYPPHCA